MLCGCGIGELDLDAMDDIFPVQCDHCLGHGDWCAVESHARHALEDRTNEEGIGMAEIGSSGSKAEKVHSSRRTCQRWSLSRRR